MFKTRYSSRVLWSVISVILLISAGSILNVGTALAEQAETETEAAGSVYRLPVFATSDIHGWLINTEEPYEYRVPYIADKINDERRSGGSYDPDRTVLVDGGDIFQGSALSYLLKGESMSAVFDKMQYDAVTVGNHDFDWDAETVFDSDATIRDYTQDGKTCENRIPVVCSNIYKDGVKASFTRDFVILDKKAVSESGEELPVRVAVLGFADEYSDQIVPACFNELGYTISQDYTELERLAGELEENHACDATILLFHGDARILLKKLGDDTCIDLAICGHTHQNEMYVADGGLTYLEPEGSANAYLYADLTFERGEDGTVRFMAGNDNKAGYFSLLDLDNSELTNTPENADDLDQEVVAIVDRYLEETRPVMNEELGYVTEPVTWDPIDGSDERSSTLGNFVNDTSARAVGAEVSFTNKFGPRAILDIDEDEDRRIVTVGDIYAMMPFDNKINCYEMTYGDLLDVLDYSMTVKGRRLLGRMTGIDCWFVTDPEGTEVEEDGKKVAGKYLIDALEMNGQLIYKEGVWIDDWKDKKVKVAANDYIASVDREWEGMHNPLCAYNETDRLISQDVNVREGMIDVLREEGKENDGHLFVDTHPYFHFGKYGESEARSNP